MMMMIMTITIEHFSFSCNYLTEDNKYCSALDVILRQITQAVYEFKMANNLASS